MADGVRRLVLLRHGRTSWNIEGRAQGHADVGLDEVGARQAARVADSLASLRPALLWSSDLARARRTADEVAAACGLPVVEDPRLREFSVGERQGLTLQESLARFPWLAEATEEGLPLRDIPGAETDDDVRTRIGPAMEECLGATAPGETAVVVSHGAAIRVALACLLGWDRVTSRGLGVLDNCCGAIVEVVPSGRRRLSHFGVRDFASVDGIG